MAVVVDTDVISFLFKRDTRAILYRPHVDDEMLVMSFMSLAELERWAITALWGDRRRSELIEYLKRYLIEPSSPKLCRGWASNRAWTADR